MDSCSVALGYVDLPPGGTEQPLPQEEAPMLARILGWVRARRAAKKARVEGEKKAFHDKLVRNITLAESIAAEAKARELLAQLVKGDQP